VLDSIVLITASKGASSRTKNRIRENGHAFSVKDGPKSAACFNGRVSIRVEAVKPKPNGEHWDGWFPVDEILVVEEEDPDAIWRLWGDQ